MGVVHIGVGFLRCSFPIIGIAKALNMERTKVRDSHVFYANILISYSV